MIEEADEASDRARQIMLAAYELLDEDGLEGLTIRAVLARTGLARRAFYDRFAGKDDLVLAVFAYTLREAARIFGHDVLALPDPLARLHHIVDGIVLGGFALEEGGPGGRRRGAALSREHLRLAESRPAELQRAISPLIDLIAAQLADGLAAGQIRDAPPHRLAALIYNLVSTTVHVQLMAEEGRAPDPLARRAMAREIWDFCARAVIA